jgi:hypothetical protein
MEHRKRSMMQHKVEISTLLRIVIENKKSGKFQYNGKNPPSLTKALATEAIESLKNCDHCAVTAGQDKNIAWIY